MELYRLTYIDHLTNCKIYNYSTSKMELENYVMTKELTKGKHTDNIRYWTINKLINVNKENTIFTDVGYEPLYPIEIEQLFEKEEQPIEEIKMIKEFFENYKTN